MREQPAILRNPFVRNLQSGNLYELFFVSAVSTILITRTILSLTGYPQLGSNGLHIAHVLPGGLLMAVALIVTLGFLNKESRGVAALVGGIGFGLFIDELGKFITSDTNYFFEPTVSLIYVVFIGLFLIVRTIQDRRVNRQEYLVNAVESTKDVVIHDLDRAEQRQALAYLKRGDPKDPAVKALRALLQRYGTMPVDQSSYLFKVRRWLSRRYRSLVRRAWFNQAVISFFVVGSGVSLGRAIFDATARRDEITVSEWGELISSAVAGVLVLVGIYQLIRRSRLAAYQTFKRAVLISLFLTQFFVFFRDQFWGLIGLAVSLVTLITLDYVIREERFRRPTGR